MFEPLDDDQWEQINDHLYNDRKDVAIELMSQWTGVDLTDAKDMIDECDRQLRIQHPDRFAKTKAKAGGCATAVFVLAVSTVMITATAAVLALSQTP